LVTKDDGADVALPVFKLNVNRPDVGAELSATVRNRDFLLRTFLKLQLIGNVFGNTEK
jgi:hypothetical protein